MYRELVLELTKGNEWVKVQPPCSETVISEAEKVVGYSFPEELKNLLREMNGDKWLFLSAEEIIENVKLNREIFLPLFEEDYSKEEYQERVDRFIFFATNGCGDYYCYRVCPNGTADKSVIYIWEHEYIGDNVVGQPKPHALSHSWERGRLWRIYPRRLPEKKHSRDRRSRAGRRKRRCDAPLTARSRPC